MGDVPSCAALGLASPEAMHEPVMARETSNMKRYLQYSTYMSWKLDLYYSNHFVKQYIVHLHQSHFLSVVTFFSAVLLS